jgi:dTDP-4-dehydrorhamnose reductase
MRYLGTVSSGSRSDCQAANVTGPLELLRAAQEIGDSFVLLSREVVFDLSTAATVEEDTPPFPACHAGKMLRVAEKAVLKYDKGYVLRVGELLDDTVAALDALEEMPESFENATLRPLCRECVTFLIERIPELVPPGAPGRLVHAVPFCSFELAAVLMQRHGAEQPFETGEGLRAVIPLKKLVFSGRRVSEMLAPDELIAYLRANEENCRWKLFRD